MTSVLPFTCSDLLAYNGVNVDALTETYGLKFYLQYLATWPELFSCAKTTEGDIMGYCMGKAEGRGELWHGHVTAVTVAPTYRRQGLARALMGVLGTDDRGDARRVFRRSVRQGVQRARYWNV